MSKTVEDLFAGWLDENASDAISEHVDLEAMVSEDVTRYVEDSLTEQQIADVLGDKVYDKVADFMDDNSDQLDELVQKYVDQKLNEIAQESLSEEYVKDVLVKEVQAIRNEDLVTVVSEAVNKYMMTVGYGERIEDVREMCDDLKHRLMRAESQLKSQDVILDAAGWWLSVMTVAIITGGIYIYMLIH